MIISKFGITFKRLKEEDIELVRQWRNSPEISQYMEYREYITPEMQMKWFDSVNNNNNFYFIIEYQGKKVGLINGKDIDWEKYTMETGIFFWDKEIYNTPVPIIAVMIFAEVGIFIGGLSVYARILKTNERARKYNEMIGFELCEGQEEVENQLYRMTPESYLGKSDKIRKAYYAMTGHEMTKFVVENEDIESGLHELITSRYNRSMVKDIQETEEGRIYYFMV